MNSILFFPFFAMAGILAVLVGILIFAFWLWMLIDCIKRGFRKDIEKVIWVLVIIFATWIGALVYFFVIRNGNTKGLMKK